MGHALKACPRCRGTGKVRVLSSGEIRKKICAYLTANPDLFQQMDDLQLAEHLIANHFYSHKSGLKDVVLSVRNYRRRMKDSKVVV